MAPTALYSQAQQSQHNGTHKHKKKQKGGLLSKLFGSFRRSSSAPTRVSTGVWGAPGSAAGVACQATATPAASPFASPVASMVGTLKAADCEAASSPWLGYQTGLFDKYNKGKELGRGGNGVVFTVIDRETGVEYACKSIRKVLPDASEKKKSGHLESIRREVQVLTKLKGSLNIVKLEDVYEDEERVFIVMELCKGGELWHAIGDRHYSERTVASYMRAVLRTLAQCHAQHILHRDIKPGNFMLLSGDERAPLKAIDFGLATPFEPEHLPRTDLGLEGTPWYMAPETLRSEWMPASDIWAAGVMAFQMLCGRFPFDDTRNAYAPAVTAIWRSVLNDDLDFNKPWWNGISEEAKDFCRMLLQRDPAKRPTAKEALKHPWLRGNSSERSTGKKLSQSVVARIQRFAAGSQFKRTVFQMIASELLSHPTLLQREPSRGAATSSMDSSGSGRAIIRPDSAALQPLLQQLSLDGDADQEVDVDKLGKALQAMGFRLDPSEVERLLEQVDLDGSGGIDRAAFTASQMDWRALQQNHAEVFLDLAAKAFQTLDLDGSGVLEVSDLLACLRAKLPPDEVNTALELALQEAGATNLAGGGVEAANGIDFEAFMSLLKVGSLDSLDLYDDRMSVRSAGGTLHGPGSVDRLNSLLAATGNWSRHGPGASRHGPDASVHSEHSDISQMPDNDRSLHGQQQQPGIVFRFDVAGKKELVASNPIPIGASSGSIAAAAAPGSNAGGMVWRFDVAGKQPPASQPPQTIWRFDVAGPGSANKPPASSSVATSATISHGGAAGAGLTSPNGSTHNGGSGSGRTGPMVGLGRQGGYFDKRHHGSDLYRNVALRALQAAGHPTRLDPVKE